MTLTIIPDCPSPSPQLQVVFEWFDAWSHAKAEKFEAVLQENYIHHILPSSMGFPDWTKDECMSNCEEFVGLMKTFTVQMILVF
jgi:hypothetical protein